MFSITRTIFTTNPSSMTPTGSPEPAQMFDDNQSLDASLQDFEPQSASEFGGSRGASHSPLRARSLVPRFQPTLFPSNHSDLHSDHLDSASDSEGDNRSESSGGYSPPAFRRTLNGRSSGYWNRHDNVLKRRRSVDWETGDENDATLDTAAALARAKQDRLAEELTAAIRIPLPAGSMSPEKRRSPSPAPADRGSTKGSVKKEHESAVSLASIPENAHPLMSLNIQASYQQRTDSFERVFSAVTRPFEWATRSKKSFVSSILLLTSFAVVIKSIFTPGIPPPVPDLVKVAGLAKAFEPLIYYSENGINQVGDLQATGLAVWDLGESVRWSNFTSAPIIVKELDDLSENLKTLSIELTRFFANVDGDVDGILIVIDWAQRELSHLPSGPPSAMTSLFTNTYNMLAKMHVLENANGRITPLGTAWTTILGPTPTQRTTATLTRTFHEFLQVLEEAINSELQHSASLFALFESIEKRFDNLARAVVRETDTQERLESELLSSLWTRILGANGKHLRKYEQNRRLLLNVREKTVRNKKVLVDHNGKLLSLKANLEMLRMRLVSPLVRGENGRGSLSVAEQIKGLERTGEHLRGARERQKRRLMEVLYGAGTNRKTIVQDEERHEIEGY